MIRKNKILLAIILIPLVLIIPMNVLLIFNSQRQINYAKQEVISENVALLQMYAGVIEKEFTEVENYIKFLTEESYPYLKMSEKGFDKSHPDFYATQNQLISELSKYKSSNSNITNIMTYFKSSDVTLNQDKIAFNKVQMVYEFDQILRNAENLPVLNKGKGWYYFEKGTDIYVAQIVMNEYARCMITISINELLNGLERSEDSESFRYYFLFKNNYVKEVEKIAEQINIINKANLKVYIDNKYYYNNSIDIMDLNLSMGSLIDEDYLNHKIPSFIRVIWIFSVCACFIGPIISLILLVLVERPLKQLNAGMEAVRKGYTEYRIPIKNTNWQSEFDELNSHFNVMLDELETTKIRLYQEEIDRQKIQLRYLNQQIRPHFILNALNIIYMYEDDEFPIAKKMVIYLTKYFRYLVNLKSDYVLLWEEMEHMENYLNIQKVRYPNRFTHFVEWEDDIKNVRVPAVVIQTFVENSIKYGFEKGNSMFIFVLAKKINEEKIEIVIADTGKGFPKNQLDRIHTFLDTRKYDDGMGIGIQNVVNRLDILFEKNYKIDIGNAEDGGVRVCLEIPLMRE